MFADCKCAEIKDWCTENEYETTFFTIISLKRRDLEMYI